MAADEWVPSQWLVQGLLASAISGASFVFVAFACEYVKRYHRERQERQHQVILQKLLRGEIPVERNNTLALVPARTSVGTTPGSARGSLMVDSYKQSGGFLGVGRGYYTTQARAWQMLDSGLRDNRTYSGHVTVWSAESSVDKAATPDRGDGSSARIFPLTGAQRTAKNHLQPAADQAETSYSSRLSHSGPRSGDNNSVCRKACEELCTRMVREHPFIAPFLRRDLIEELKLEVPVAPENPNSGISEGAGDKNPEEPAGNCEAELEPKLSVNGGCKKGQLACRPADKNADPIVPQNSRVDQIRKVRSLSRAPTSFDLRCRPGIYQNTPRCFDKRAQSVSRTSAPGTTPSPLSVKPIRGRSVSRYLQPKDAALRVDSRGSCLVAVEKSPSIAEKEARYIPGSNPVLQTPVQRAGSMDKPSHSLKRFMGNRRSSSVISKKVEQDTTKRDQIGESKVQSPKHTISRENIALKQIAQHGSSVDPPVLDCRHEVKGGTGSKRGKGKNVRKRRDIGSVVEKPDQVLPLPDETTQEEREDEIRRALAKWGFPIRSRLEHKHNSPDMEVTQPEPKATDFAGNLDDQLPRTLHDAKIASDNYNSTLNVKKDLAKTKKKNKFLTQTGQAIGRHKMMRSNMTVPKVSADKNQRHILKSFPAPKQALLLKRRPAQARAPEATADQHPGSKTDHACQKEMIIEPKSPVTAVKNTTVELKTNQSIRSKSDEKLQRSTLYSTFHRVTHTRERSRSDDNMKANRLTRDEMSSPERYEGNGPPRLRSGQSPQERKPSGQNVDVSECSGDHASAFNVGNGDVSTKETTRSEKEHGKLTEARKTDILEDSNSAKQTLILTTNETSQDCNKDSRNLSGLNESSSFMHEKEISRETPVILGHVNPRNSNHTLKNIKKILSNPPKTSRFTRNLKTQTKTQSFLKTKHVVKNMAKSITGVQDSMSRAVNEKNTAGKQRESPEKSNKSVFKPQVSQTLVNSQEKRNYFVKRPSPHENFRQSQLTHFKTTADKQKSLTSPLKRTENTLVKTVQHRQDIRKTPMKSAKQEPQKTKKEDQSSTEGRSRFDQYLKNKRQRQECCLAAQTASLNQPEAATPDPGNAELVIECIVSPRLALKPDSISGQFSEFNVEASSFNVGASSFNVGASSFNVGASSFKSQLVSSGKLPRGKKHLQHSPRPGPESCLTGIHSQRRASSLEDITELSPESFDSPPHLVKQQARCDSNNKSPDLNKVSGGTSRGPKSSPTAVVVSREASWSKTGKVESGNVQAKELNRQASNCSRKSPPSNAIRG